MIENISKPCLVQTPQGFSVSYKERFLYSKYNPSKSILQNIENTKLQEGTLILCCSPILDYGLKELSAKLTNNCFLLLCEADQTLFDLQKEQIKILPPNTARVSPSELFQLPKLLQKCDYTFSNGEKLPPAGTFRRVLRIDFSAGTSFSPEFYNELYAACFASVKTFWTNRITLTRFGRKYSRNFFTNLKKVPQTVPVEKYFESVGQAMVVCGAGESLNNAIEKLKSERNNYFIICVDTALSTLLKNQIEPDAVFIEEAQSIIIKAFIGCQNKNIHIFSGLSSVPQITQIFAPDQISFFTTLYTNSSFIERMQSQHILPPANNPLGSVGLTAIEYALKFRKSEDVPVYVYGLDFSYTTGITHAKGTMAHLSRLITSNKLTSAENYGAAFGIGTETFLDKSGNKMITTPNLKNYALLFQDRYSHVPNLFDASISGIPLGLPHKIPEGYSSKISKSIIHTPCWTLDSIQNFFTSERKALEELRDILTGAKSLSEQERSKKIELLAKPREYLYLHFPDGHNFSMEISFLKRLRAQIDYFLKYM